MGYPPFDSLGECCEGYTCVNLDPYALGGGASCVPNEMIQIATGTWVLGANGKTCQDTCALTGTTCNAAMQSSLVTNELLKEAMEKAGHVCETFHLPDSSPGNPLSTGRSNEDCTPIQEGFTSSCTEMKSARYRALCYCE